MNNLGKEFFIVDKQQVNKYNWTKEQINYIINTYLQDKKSQKVIADEFNVTQGTIRNILIKYRINLKSDNKKYEKDESFFEVMVIKKLIKFYQNIYIKMQQFIWNENIKNFLN